MTDAIVHLHKTNNLVEAERHLARLFAGASDRLKDSERIDNAIGRLRAYERWSRLSRVVTLQCCAQVVLRFGPDNVIDGEIDRVDATVEGYQGVLLGRVSPQWEDELRFPLLQIALSHLYKAPVDRTKVGVQQLDGSGLSVRTFDAGERHDALGRLNGLGRALSGG